MEILGPKDKFCELWRLLKAKDAKVVKWSQSKWLRKGDAHSKKKKIHNCVKSRALRNSLKARRVNDGWFTSLFDVRKTVLEFFANHVKANTWERPKLDEVLFDRFSNEENDALIAPFFYVGN